MSLYDIEKFDPQPDPDLVCCICQCVLYKAVESPCRHVFCQACIERWLSKRHTCPTCRKRTKKVDLKPVLPLVQNMLNRLLMKCDYSNNGCLQKIMLEHYEGHIKDCGYEMKTCRFIKCGQKILKMDLERHENEVCEHRESVCEGECGLMIALSDKLDHNCVCALKVHIEEKNRMIETLKTKLQELNNLSQTLNDQLEQLRQQLDESRPIYFSPLLSSSSESVVSGIMEDSLREVSMDIDSSISNDTLGNNNRDVESTDDNYDGDERNEAIDVVQQVERTVVTSLIDLSSRLERVRDQMRSVLDRGVMDEDNNLNDDVHIPSDALNAIVNNSHNASSTSGPTQNNSWNTPRTENGDSPQMNSGTNDVLDVSRERSSSEHNDSEHQAVTEYSPASFYSNSDVSDGEWDTHAAARNQNGSFADYDIHQTNNLQENILNERARSTQSWVQSVIHSPIHSIESQPPRSPSESESSYSSIPSMSSVHSINSGVNHDLARSYSNSDVFDNEANSPDGMNSYTSPSSSIGNSSLREDSHTEEISLNHEYSNADRYKNSTRTSSPSNSSDFGTLQGSSIDEHSDIESYSSQKSKGSHEYSDRNSSVGNQYSNENTSDDSVDNTNSEKSRISSHYQRDVIDDKGEGSHTLKEQNSSPFNNETVESFISSEVSCNSIGQSIVLADNDENQSNDVHSSKKLELNRNSTSDQSFDKCNTLSDGSDHSEHENSRRTWKYETNTPVHRYNTSVTKTIASATMPWEHGVDEGLQLNTQSSLILPVCASISDQSTLQNPMIESVNLKARRNYVQSNKNKTSDWLNDTTERKKLKHKIKFQSSLKASSPNSTDQKDIRLDTEGNIFGNPTNLENFNDNNRKSTECRKRRHDKLHDVSDINKRYRYDTATCSSNSSGYNSQPSKQSSPRADSSQNNWTVRPSIAASSNTQNHDKSTQSLNVKIDLSLINYTGDILTQPVVTQSVPTSGSTIIHNSISPQHCSVLGALRQPRNSSRNIETQSSGQTKHHNSQRKMRETRSAKNIGAGNEAPHSDVTGHREFPNLWCDDSDSTSDKTWEPEAGDDDKDVTVSEGDTESETDYEVKVPKSTYDLIQEYASDDTDEGWTYGLESVD